MEHTSKCSSAGHHAVTELSPDAFNHHAEPENIEGDQNSDERMGKGQGSDKKEAEEPGSDNILEEMDSDDFSNFSEPESVDWDDDVFEHDKKEEKKKKKKKEKSGTAAEHAARDAFFGTVELFEAALCLCDERTVLIAQRVNKRFKHVIAGSTALQQKLWLQIDSSLRPDEGNIFVNPLLLRYGKRSHVLYHITSQDNFGWRPSWSPAPSVLVTGQIPFNDIKFELGGPDKVVKAMSTPGSWKRMIIYQPNPFETKRAVIMCPEMFEQTSYWQCGVDGYTWLRTPRVGELMEVLLQRAAEKKDNKVVLRGKQVGG